MAIDREFKQYIDMLLKDLKVENSAVIGTRKPGSPIGENSLIVGTANKAEAPHSAAIGSNNEVDVHADSAVALGEGTRAYSKYQLVHGKFNDSDSNNIYAHIVGGGNYDAPKNIYTLDWEGNATFAGAISTNKAPTSGNDLVNLDYLNQNVAIRFFPYTVIDDTTAIIRVNELDPYTIYKVKMDKPYATIKFAVKAQNGRDVFFLTSDPSINKYNMFVSSKTENSMTLFVNSVMYTIDLITGKVTKTIDGSFAGPGTGGGSDDTVGDIDDTLTDKTHTWSSEKISEIINNITTALDKTFDEVKVVEDIYNEKRDANLIFYNKGEELHRVPLPLAWFIKEGDLARWNDVVKKMNLPEEDGQEGQILSYVGLDENNQPITKWIDKPSGGSGEGGSNNAEDIEYINGDVSNVKEALDKLLYTPPSITSFSASPQAGNYDIGRVLGPITFSWTFNKAVTSQTITDIGDIPLSDRSAQYNSTISTNKTFTITASDGKQSVTRSLSYNFMHRAYWGASTAPTSYAGAFISNNLSSNQLTTSYARTINITTGPGQYMYYCYPTSWRNQNITFNVGGFDGGFQLIGTVEFDNGYNNVTTYDIWRSDYPNLGTQSVKIYNK